MENEILKLYTEWCTEFCDAPPVFHQAVLYSITGLLIGRRRFIQYGDGELIPNTWMVLLAPSSTYRKSTCIKIGLKMALRINPYLKYPNEFSHEKMVSIMEKQPIGVFVFDEFLSLLGLLSRDYMAGTKAFLTEIFDSENYIRKTGQADVNISGASVSILSATTIDWIKSSIQIQDLMGGFMTRFLFVPAFVKPSTIYDPPPADEKKRAEILNRFRLMLGLDGRPGTRDTGFDKKELILSIDARKYFITASQKMETELEKTERKENVLLKRSDIYVRKLSIIIQTLMDSTSDEITLPAMEEAVTFVKYCRHGVVNDMMDELSFNKSEDKIKKIFKIIKKNPEGITRENLYRRSHYTAPELNPIIQTLMEQGTITTERQRAEGADKPAIIYKVKKEGITI